MTSPKDPIGPESGLLSVGSMDPVSEFSVVDVDGGLGGARGGGRRWGKRRQGV